MTSAKVRATIFKFYFLVFPLPCALWSGLSSDLKLNLSFQKLLPTYCFMNEITSLYL